MTRSQPGVWRGRALLALALAAMGTNCVPSAPIEGTVTSVEDDTICVDLGGQEDRCVQLVDLEEYEPQQVGDCARVDEKQPTGDIYRVLDC
ncbi:MAG: hypothetical protein ACR2HR_17090 [Euzebya sp.]